MGAFVMIAIFLTAWYCSVDTNSIFAPQNELLAVKFLSHVDETGESISSLVESTDENVVNIAVRNMVMDILRLPLLLFSPYPLWGIVMIISLVHIFRDKDYKKQGQELKASTIRKWGAISNILVIAFMLFAYFSAK